MTCTTKQFCVILCSLVVGFVAALVNADALYFLSAFLMMVPLGAWLFGKGSLQSLGAYLGPAAPVVAGDTMDVAVEVVNGGLLPRFNIRLDAPLPAGLSAAYERNNWESGLSLQEDQVKKALPSGSSRKMASTTIPQIPGRNRAVAHLKVQTDRRGLFSMDSLVFTHEDPLNLSFVHRHLPFSGEALVYPRPLGVSLAPLFGGDLMGSEQTARSRGSVDGSDFYGIRPYRAGDEWRRIHWPTTARTGELMVVEREALASLSLVVVLDITAAPGDTDSAPLEVLIRLAAQFAEEAVRRASYLYILLLEQDGRVSLTLDRCLNREAALDTLARLDPARLSEQQSALPEEIPSLIGPGPSIVLLTDHLDDRVTGIVQVSHRSSWPGAVILLDPGPNRDHGPGIHRSAWSTTPDLDEQEQAISRVTAMLPIWRLRQSVGEGDYSVEPVARV